MYSQEFTIPSSSNNNNIEQYFYPVNNLYEENC